MATGIQKNFRFPPTLYQAWEETANRVLARQAELSDQDVAMAAVMLFLELPTDEERLKAIGRARAYPAEWAAQQVGSDSAPDAEAAEIVARADAAARRSGRAKNPRPRRPAG